MWSNRNRAISLMVYHGIIKAILLSYYWSLAFMKGEHINWERGQRSREYNEKLQILI